MKLRVHRFLSVTNVEGPGKRACIWVQGCPIHCPGCAAPGTWDPDGGELWDTDELVQRMVDGPQVEGVTFVGGEPFAQAQALAVIGRTLKDYSFSVVTFTGYTIEEIQKAQRQAWDELLTITDLLIDGSYRQDLADLSRPWVGSSNQRYHFLTPRYRELERELPNIPNRIEVHLDADARIFINGMGEFDKLRNLVEGEIQ